MKKTILLMIFLTIAISSMGQVNQKDQTISSIINLAGSLVSKYYHPTDDSVKSGCWEGCVFIRFNVDKKGKIVNIAYNATTPIFIKDALDHGFAELNKENSVVGNLKPYINKAFVLPLIVANNEGCGFPSPWDGYSKKPDEKMATIYDQRRMRYDQYSNSVGSMIYFNNESRLSFVDCILLTPVYTPSPMY